MEVKVGKNLLSITEECKDTKELFKKAGFYGTIPSACGNCESDNLMLNHRQAQGKYDYYSVDCKDCGHRLNYGINNNEDETLFAKLKDGWEPPYQADGDEEGSTKSSGKSSGTSALQRAKAAKAAKAAAQAEDSSEEEETEEVAEEVEEKTETKKKSRSDILAKFGKKKASA